MNDFPRGDFTQILQLFSLSDYPASRGYIFAVWDEWRTFKTVDTAWRAIRNCSCIFNLIMTGEGVSLFIFISNAMYIFRFFCGHLRTTQNSLNYVCIHICLHGSLICWKSEIWSLIVIINCICSVCKLKKSKGIWRAFREKREHFNQSLYRICVTWPT